MYNACKRNDVEKVRLLLSENKYIYGRDIQIACQKNSIETINLLLEREIIKNSYVNNKIASTNFRISISWLSKHNQLDVIKKLFNISKDRDKEQCLIYFCENNDVDAIKYLLEECKDMNVNREFMFACKQNKIKVINALIDKAGNKDDCLVEACKRGYEEQIKILLEAGADPTTHDSFTIYCENGNTYLIPLFLSSNTSLIEKAIFINCKNKNMQMIESLIGRVNSVDPRSIVYCLLYDRIDLAECMVKKCNNFDYNIALLRCCKDGNVNSIKFLLENGADPNTKYSFYYCCRRNSIECIKLFLNYNVCKELKICIEQCKINNNKDAILLIEKKIKDISINC